MSVTSRIISSSRSRFCRFLADTSTMTVWPPHSSGIRPRSDSSRLTRSGFASGLSILLMATMIGTPAAFAWSIASRVCGMTPSSAATTRMTMSVTRAPRARIRVNASWPGRVEEDHAAVVDLHVVGADVLRDAARLALGDAGLADAVEQRRLAVVDVAHDGDDGRARDAILGMDVHGLDLEQFLFEAAQLDLGAELARDHRRGVDVQRRVDRHHDPLVEELLQDVLRAEFELVGQVLDGHAFGERDRARDRRRRRRHRHRRHARRLTPASPWRCTGGRPRHRRPRRLAGRGGGAGRAGRAGRRLPGRTGCDGSGRAPPAAEPGRGGSVPRPGAGTGGRAPAPGGSGPGSRGRTADLADRAGGGGGIAGGATVRGVQPRAPAAAACLRRASRSCGGTIAARPAASPAAASAAAGAAARAPHPCGRAASPAAAWCTRRGAAGRRPQRAGLARDRARRGAAPCGAGRGAGAAGLGGSAAAGGSVAAAAVRPPLRGSAADGLGCRRRGRGRCAGAAGCRLRHGGLRAGLRCRPTGGEPGVPRPGRRVSSTTSRRPRGHEPAPAPAGLLDGRQAGAGVAAGAAACGARSSGASAGGSATWRLVLALGLRPDRLHQARRRQRRRGRLRRLRLLGGSASSRLRLLRLVDRRLGEHVAARQRQSRAAAPSARRTAWRRPLRSCSTRSSPRSRDRA